MKVLRYNGYGEESSNEAEKEENAPEHGVAARFDLYNGREIGGIDSKAVDRKLVDRMELVAINGPTREGKLPTFSFADRDVGVKGVPKEFAFSWVVLGRSK